MMSSVLGTVFYSVIVFVAGALVGRPLYSWATKWLPWNK
jgi:hypothetical protein